MIYLDYYHRPFMLFSKAVEVQINKTPHPKRISFWSLIPEGVYDYFYGRMYLNAYYNSLLNEMQAIIEKKSILYWVHLSRRILPACLGEDKTPMTILITRKILDAAFEKFGMPKFCEHIGVTHEISMDKIFDGLLMSDSFLFERTLLEKTPPQIVLTKFNHTSYLEYFNLEKLSFEIWRCGSTLRIIGKGSNLIVRHDTAQMFFDNRSDEMEFLLKNYDERKGSLTTSKGITLDYKDAQNAGLVFVPQYNVTYIEGSAFNVLFEKTKANIKFGENMIPNFIVYDYPLGNFYHNNKPLFSKFKYLHKTSLISVISVIAAILWRIFHKLMFEKDTSFLSIMLRGYQGPYLEIDIIKELISYRKYSDLLLGLSEEEKKEVDINDGYYFLKLHNREIIDLIYPAPLKLFLPVSKDRVLIDYSKIVDILDNLMFGVRIDDENFKGMLFEEAVSVKHSILPQKQCIAKDNSRKQIDFAFSVNEILVICECKIKEISIGFFKGDRQSIDTRRKNVVEKSINEADNKALWLVKNPIGRNYDISSYKYILPIGISAYKEYIHSANKKFWITNTIPRVLSLDEFKELIDEEIISNRCYNLLNIELSK